MSMVFDRTPDARDSLEMEAGLIRDHDMERKRVGVGDLA